MKDNQDIPILELYRWPDIDNELAKEMYTSVVKRAETVRIELEKLHAQLEYVNGKEYESLVRHIYRVFARHNGLHEAAEIMLQLADNEKDKR